MISNISRLLLAGSIAITLFAVAAPFSNPSAEPKDERLALATTSIICDLARNVAGELWTVECLVGPGVNPHTYEPTPEDMVKAETASIIFYNGFNLDAWVVKLLRSQQGEKLYRVTQGLEKHVIKIPDGPYAGREDPHLWMDVSIAVEYVKNIRDVFVRHDPVNREAYISNAAKYIEKLEELDAWIKTTVSKIPVEKRVLVTQENAFQYFSRAYGFTVGAYFYSIATEIEPAPTDLIYAVNRVKQLGVCVYFVESTLSNRLMLTLIREAGGRLAGVLYADGLGGHGSGAETYLGMMRTNVETIAAELVKGC